MRVYNYFGSCPWVSSFGAAIGGLGYTRGVGQERDRMGAARSQGTAGGIERTDGEIPCGQGDVLDGRTALTTQIQDDSSMDHFS